MTPLQSQSSPRETYPVVSSGEEIVSLTVLTQARLSLQRFRPRAPTHRDHSEDASHCVADLFPLSDLQTPLEVMLSLDDCVGVYDNFFARAKSDHVRISYRPTGNTDIKGRIDKTVGMRYCDCNGWDESLLLSCISCTARATGLR